MTSYNFRLRLISPTFIAGSDKNRPEMRAASIRGQLRYWFRALVGASTDSLEEIWKRESDVFGSTGGGSAVSVRVYSNNSATSADYAMLPHREHEGRRALSITRALKPGQVYDLQLVTRPGVALSNDVLNALKLWSLLGGIGRRSRRMFGAIQTTTSDNVIKWQPQPQTSDELANQIREALQESASASPQPAVPQFPTLNSSHCWVIVGKSPYTDFEGPIKALFRDLLRRPPHLDSQQTFGGINPRRSSPLIAQLRHIRIDGEDSYYPILTALRSKPDNNRYNIDWGHLKRFMEDAESYFSAERVWGGW